MTEHKTEKHSEMSHFAITQLLMSEIVKLIYIH